MRLFLPMIAAAVAVGGSWATHRFLLSPPPPSAQATTRTPLGVPHLFAESELIDVGRLGPTDIGRGTIVLFNGGSKEFVVDGIVPDCGCTTAQLGLTSLGAGATVKIPLVVDAARAGGSSFRKRVLVRLKERRATAEGAAGATANLIFYVAGSVDHSLGLVAVPGSVDFGELTPGARAAGKVQVRGDEAVLKALPEKVQVDLLAPRVLTLRVDRPTGRVSTKPVVLEGAAPHGPARRLISVVRFEVRGEVSKDLEVAVRARAVPGVRAVPDALLLSTRDGSPRECSFRVVAGFGRKEERPAHIEEIWSDLPVVCEQVAGASPSPVVRVRLAPSTGRPAPRTGRIRLKIRGLDQPVEVACAIIAAG